MSSAQKKTKKKKTKDTTDGAEKKPAESAGVEDANAPSSLFYGIATKHSVRREKLKSLFSDLAEVVLASDPSRRGPLKNSALANEAAGSEDYFPTLQVGYVARAMGLNLSQSDLVYVVQLVEYDAPSSGAVSKSRLESVLVDAMMTNVLGGDTLKATGIIPLDRFGSPISVQRNTLDEVYRAFKAIDKDNKGYLEPEELKAAMTSEGERFTEDEMEEMLQALVDPETGRLIYEDIAGILSSE